MSGGGGGVTSTGYGFGARCLEQEIQFFLPHIDGIYIVLVIGQVLLVFYSSVERKPF